MDCCALRGAVRSPAVGLELGRGVGASDEMRRFFAGGPSVVDDGLTNDGGRKGLPIMAGGDKQETSKHAVRRPKKRKLGWRLSSSDGKRDSNSR